MRVREVPPPRQLSWLAACQRADGRRAAGPPVVAVRTGRSRWLLPRTCPVPAFPGRPLWRRRRFCSGWRVAISLRPSAGCLGTPGNTQARDELEEGFLSGATLTPDGARAHRRDLSNGRL